MRKTGKRIASLLLALLMVAGVMPIMAISVGAASAMPGEGMAFDNGDRYEMSKDLTISGDITIESEVWIDPTTSDGSRPGVIVGNYQDQPKLGKSWSFELYEKGAVRLYTNKNFFSEFKFDVRTVTTGGSFAKITVVVG